jgi:hypothetical protein
VHGSPAAAFAERVAGHPALDAGWSSASDLWFATV